MYPTLSADLVTVHWPPLLVSRLAPAGALACVAPPELLVVERLLRAPPLLQMLPPGRLARACAVQSGRVCFQTRLSGHASGQLRRSIYVGHILKFNSTTSFLEKEVSEPEVRSLSGVWSS